jgi:hypothetical protein
MESHAIKRELDELRKLKEKLEEEKKKEAEKKTKPKFETLGSGSSRKRVADMTKEEFEEYYAQLRREAEKVK